MLAGRAAKGDSVPMDDNSKSWDQVLNDLESLYRNVERRSLSLATFSLLPFLIAMWNSVKFMLLFYVDVLLIVPLNVVVFLRNLFPGKWPYRSFSWRYIKYVALWIWRGEVPQIPFVAIRSLTTWFLHAHFRSRLRLLRRSIMLADDLSTDDRTSVLSRIDQLLEVWEGPRVLFASFTYGLPAAGFLLEIYRTFQPQQLPPWTGTAALFLIIYALSFVASAFIIKRGLMLGAVGRSAYFPGALKERGGYGEENRIFDMIGLRAKEFPFDMLLALVGVPLGFLSIDVWLSLYESWGVVIPRDQMIVQQPYSFAVFVSLGVLALYRRMRLRRA
jgi:hypothetical protein